MRKPNLLFIFTDEQRCDTLAAYGNTRIAMPNLNRFAEQSVVFERAYCTQPVCTASRSSILTGLYPHANGCVQNNVPLRPEIPTLPELLPPGEYATGYVGKWHLGDEIFAQHGFNEWVSVEDNYIAHYSPKRDRNARSDYHQFLLEKQLKPDPKRNLFTREYSARLPEELGKPAFLAREASRFLREHHREPFILYVNFLEPHMPFFGPRDGQYDPNALPLPANYGFPPTADQHVKLRLLRQCYYDRGMSGLPLKTEADWRRMVSNYWGLNSLVDTHVGTILKTAEACGLLDDTIIVFTSDHGDMMGSHQLIAKCVMFEEAARVPLLLHLPGQKSQRRITKRVSQIDLVPTLLDLLGQPIPESLQGHSRKREAESGKNGAEEDVFIEWNGTESGILEPFEKGPYPDSLAKIASREVMLQAVSDPIRTVITPDGWKLNWSQLGQHELYNLNADPIEVNNLAKDAKHQAKLRELREKIRRWQEAKKDLFRI